MHVWLLRVILLRGSVRQTRYYQLLIFRWHTGDNHAISGERFCSIRLIVEVLWHVFHLVSERRITNCNRVTRIESTEGIEVEAFSIDIRAVNTSQISNSVALLLRTNLSMMSRDFDIVEHQRIIRTASYGQDRGFQNCLPLRAIQNCSHTFLLKYPSRRSIFNELMMACRYSPVVHYIALRTSRYDASRRI